MSKIKSFQSVLARQMELYVDDFAARGMTTKRIISVLRSFDETLCNKGYDKEYVTQEAYLGWCETLVNLSRRSAYEYKLMVSSFCKYLTRIGFASYQPPRTQYARCNHIAHIFTDEELNKLFCTVDNWRGRSFPKNSLCMIMPALLRLLYSTGIRIGEAAALLNKDVLLNKGYIMIREPKNGKDRIAPINNSLNQVLSQYLSYRNRMPIKDVKEKQSPFFVNLGGKACSVKSIERCFRKILHEAGLEEWHPRLHDLRHTACVHAMRNLIKQGMDVYSFLPKSCAYMGHTDLSSTEYYVKLTSEVYPELFAKELSYQKEVNNTINRATFYEEEF